MSTSPHEELANAVVLQAVKDYRRAVKDIKKAKRNSSAQNMKDECERFFNSKTFNIYTKLDGKMVLKQLESEVD